MTPFRISAFVDVPASDHEHRTVPTVPTDPAGPTCCVTDQRVR